MQTRIWLRFVIVGVAAAAAGCHLDNPRYCEGHPSDPDCLSGSCTSNDQCTAPTSVCDVNGTSVCVQCIAPDQTSACSGASPVCASDHTCRACTAHDQCASLACLPDGSCGDDTTVAYVDPAGTDNMMCSRALPCTKVSNSLATSRPYVKFAGTTDEGVTVDSGRTITFLAEPGAQLTRTTGTGAIMTVRDNGTSLTVYDLSISDAPNNPSGIGIVIPPAAGAPTVTLVRAKVTNNPGGGISASGGTLTVTQSTLSGNQGGGISMAVNGVISLTNNFIHHNGNTVSAAAGGISIRPMGASKIEFNTIIDNLANMGAASAGGVFCDQAGFIAANNLIFRNTGGTTGTVQTFGNCTYGNSINMPGMTPADNSLSFVRPNSPPFDFHLSASSPASVVDAAGACAGIDFDGDVRPVGGACDLGADERRP